MPVPADFGEIELFDSSDLESAQDIVRWFDRGNVALIILAILLLAFTIWVSHRRRRTLMQLGVGIAIGLVLMRRGSIIGKDAMLDNVKEEVNRDGFDAATSHVLGSYLSFTGWLIFLSVLVAVVAFLTGPNPRAEQIRQGTRRLLRSAASELMKAGSDHEDHPILQWIRSKHVSLQVGAAIVVVIAMLLFDLTWPTLVFLILLLAVFEFVIYFLTVGKRPKPVALPVATESSGELEPVAVGELGPSPDQPEAGDTPGEAPGAG